VFSVYIDSIFGDPTLILSLREASSANQSMFSPHALDLNVES
jgi:hypothetical protein